MAIFNKSDQQPNNSANITTLASGCRFTGKIEIECSLHIDGEYEGDIYSTNTVTIGKHGVVKSEIKARKLVVAGNFTGNADCEFIELPAGGTVVGTLSAASLAIDGDSTFQGESVPRDAGNPTVVDFAAAAESENWDAQGTAKAKAKTA